MDARVDAATAPEPKHSAARRVVPARVPTDVAGVLTCGAVGALLLLLFAHRWSSGWLLLLDWAPGPRSSAITDLMLPSGPGTDLLVTAARAVAPEVAGWGVVAGGVLAAYGGGVHLARSWHGPGGRPLSWTAATVGGCVAAANPFVAARVHAGQIGVLWGSALLWWLTAQLARSVERRDLRASVVPAVWCALAAACSLHMLVAGLVVAAVFAVVHSRRAGWHDSMRRFGAFTGVAVALTAVWLVPELVRSGSELGTAGGEASVRLFSSGGPLWHLWLRAAGGAGFWRPLPDGSLVAMGLLVALAWLATLLFARSYGAGWSRDLRLLLAGCAVVAVAAAHLGRGVTFGPWSWLVTWFPPAGLLREPGKLATLATMAPACGAAVATQRAVDRWAARGVRGRLATAALVLAAVAATTGAWWSLTARLEPSTYPSGWEQARQVLESDDCRVAVLGDGAYTDPGFTGSRIVAHPAAGFLGPRAVVSGDPRLEDIEPRRADTPAERWLTSLHTAHFAGAQVQPDPEAARRAGIGWVFVDRPVDRPELGASLEDAGFRPRLGEPHAGLWQVPGGCR